MSDPLEYLEPECQLSTPAICINQETVGQLLEVQFMLEDSLRAMESHTSAQVAGGLDCETMSAEELTGFRDRLRCRLATLPGSFNAAFLSAQVIRLQQVLARMEGAQLAVNMASSGPLDDGSQVQDNLVESTVAVDRLRLALSECDSIVRMFFDEEAASSGCQAAAEHRRSEDAAQPYLSDNNIILLDSVVPKLEAAYVTGQDEEVQDVTADPLGQPRDGLDDQSSISKLESADMGDVVVKAEKGRANFTKRGRKMSKKAKKSVAKYNCSDCALSFDTVRRLIDHVSTTHSGGTRARADPDNDAALKEFKCHLCPKAFSQAARLEAHIRVHTGEKPFDCATCGKSFRQIAHLKRHENVHAEERPFGCAECGGAFKRAEALARHRDGERCVAVPISCPVCAKSISHKSALAAHMKSHNRPSCPVCNKSIPRSKAMARHMKLYHEGAFNCLECRRSFATEDQLTKHLTHHAKQYDCEVCGKVFSSSTNLKYHRRTHTGERPYSCIICPKAFSQAHCLHGHMLVHSICRPCAKQLPPAASLMEPALDTTATPETRDDCVVCKQPLEKPAASSAREKQKSCSLCDETFADASQLKEHMKAHVEQEDDEFYKNEHIKDEYMEDGLDCDDEEFSL